jgi:hypothetical protein
LHALEAELPSGVHLVGSVPLQSTEEVLSAVASELSGRLRRIPDGETGERAFFTVWQARVFTRHPDFQLVETPARPHLLPICRLRAGVDYRRLQFGPLGYARAAIDSYQIFRRLKTEGVIEAGVRFQVSLPTPPNVIATAIAGQDTEAVEQAYEGALLRELDQIVHAVPNEDLAVQWDTVYEVRAWAGIIPTFMPRSWLGSKGAILERLRRYGERVPETVELGYHLCHGDYAHTQELLLKQTQSQLPPAAVASLGPPEDATAVGEIASGLAREMPRRIDFVHLPVPRVASASYFVPLRQLHLQAGTELYLGLVHLGDGIEGGKRRIAAARQVVEQFGIATECGWGRRSPDTIPQLVALHRDLAGPALSQAG